MFISKAFPSNHTTPIGDRTQTLSGVYVGTHPGCQAGSPGTRQTLRAVAGANIAVSRPGYCRIIGKIQEVFQVMKDFRLSSTMVIRHTKHGWTVSFLWFNKNSRLWCNQNNSLQQRTKNRIKQFSGVVLSVQMMEISEETNRKFRDYE